MFTARPRCGGSRRSATSWTTPCAIRLWQELGISPSEFRSLWNAVRSDVEVSLSRLLAAD